MSTLKYLLVAAASCAMASWSMAGYAATPPYNPDGLGAAQFARVADICQTVMGLHPSEPLSGGVWHNDRLDYWTSHYRGCVISLSDSLQRVSDAQVAQQADEDCRAKGFKSDSPDLALCVLRSVNSHPGPATTQGSTPAATPVSETVTPAGSFFYASAHETVRREQVACAALGLEPSHGAFESCVKGLDDTFDAIDNPIN
jgi:hypothetical protein